MNERMTAEDLSRLEELVASGRRSRARNVHIAQSIRCEDCQAYEESVTELIDEVRRLQGVEAQLDVAVEWLNKDYLVGLPPKLAVIQEAQRRRAEVERKEQGDERQDDTRTKERN